MGIHARISELEKQLDAVVVLQEEKNHEVYAVQETDLGHGMTTWDYTAGDSWVPRKTIIDEPAVTEPNIEKRRKARTKLINLKHSLWFFRYLARERVEEILSIRKSSDEIELDLAYQSIDIHRNGLSAERVVQEESGHWETQEHIPYPACKQGFDVAMMSMETGEVWVNDSQLVMGPDTEKREASKKALEKIYHATKYVTAKRKIEKVLGYAPGEKQ